MLRVIFFIVVLVLLILGAVWLADTPGDVTLQWLGLQADAPVWVVLLAVALFAVVVALLYRLWRALRRAPGSIGQAMRDGRRRRGYQALTRGMVAVAAGDAREAERQVRKADGLLGEPPLTLLLSAQSAQLSGDEAAATRFFTEMLERPETEFLGVRGLLTQALKRGDDAEALKLARRAYRLKPKSDWVATQLFDQQVRAGQWGDAEITAAEATKNKLLDAATGRRRRAVLLYRRGLDLKAAGEGLEAARLIRKAQETAPDFVPAAITLARLLVDTGKQRRAAGVVEDAWRGMPHPDLVEVYRLARPTDDPLQWVNVVRKLAETNPGHAESRLAQARAALDARLWGEARHHLEAAVADHPTARVYRMRAELEETEHGDPARGHDWLVRASMAEADPAWVCESCGSAAAEWSIRCGHCDTFDGYRWRTPPRISRLTDAVEAPTAVLEAPSEPIDAAADPVPETEQKTA